MMTMMKILRIKDNQTESKKVFHDVKDIVEKIADKTLEKLSSEGIFVLPGTLKDSDDLEGNQIILQSVNDSFKTGNVMGIVGVDDQRLIIGSRFDENDEDFFFDYLIYRVMNISNLVDMESEINDDRLFELLVFLFPRYLKLAMRKGVFKIYVRNQYNDEDVRGRIEIDRHIRTNIPFVGKIAYSQREYSYDNYMTELIRHTIEYIKSKSYGKGLLHHVKEEIERVVSITPRYKANDRRRILNINIKNRVRHAYYHEYSLLQKLCIMILRNEKHRYGNGSRNFYGVLFDGSWLWEEYVNTLIKEDFYHPQNRSKKGRQYLFDKNKAPIYPDFIGRNNDIIADAKYKPSDNIDGKDYLQILAYMFRFDAKQGFFLYPCTNETRDEKLHLNQGTTYEGNVRARDNVSVVKLGLNIPRNISSYAEFAEQINQSEMAFKRRLKILAREMTCYKSTNVHVVMEG